MLCNAIENITETLRNEMGIADYQYSSRIQLNPLEYILENCTAFDLRLEVLTQGIYYYANGLYPT